MFKLTLASLIPNVAALLMITFIGLLAYWSFWPFQTIDVQSPIPMTQETYQTGEIASYEVTYCKFTSESGTIVRTLVYDDKPVRRVFAELPAGAEKSVTCPETITAISTSLPLDIPSGRAHLEMVYRYRCSPMKTCTERAYTDTFTITNAKEASVQ